MSASASPSVLAPRCCSRLISNRRADPSTRSASGGHGRHPQRVEYCPSMCARHRVGHGVEPGLGGLGRRRACPLTGRHLRHCALDTARDVAIAVGGAGRPVDMWTTQERCPHIRRPQQHQPISIRCSGRGLSRNRRRLPLGNRPPRPSPHHTADLCRNPPASPCSVSSRTAVHTT